MATYNGARWIEPQLCTVLPQLGENDELVLVDDASSDNTRAIVEALSDPRIRIYSNERNLGVDLTFEKALTLARGDILFLCDQDDVWYPEKVNRVLKAFNDHPEVTLVLSDARIINSDGDLTAQSYFEIRGRYIPGVVANILKSKFLGCAMAVRSNMRARFLPFPARIPGHDMWIGVVNEFYGKTFYIADPLIGYRRHGNNASPEVRQRLAKMLVWRWQLVKGLAQCVLTNMFFRGKD